MDSDSAHGLMPPNPKALVAVTQMLDLMGRTTPPPKSKDTVEVLLTHVGITFYNFIAEILADPRHLPVNSYVVYTTTAKNHALTIANLLTVLSMNSREDTYRSSQNGGRDSWGVLRQRWLKAIVDVSFEEEEPAWSATATSYIFGAATLLSASTSTLLEEPRLSLDPEKAPGPPPPIEEEGTPNAAGAMLVRCAAATLCMAVLLAPDS